MMLLWAKDVGYSSEKRCNTPLKNFLSAPSDSLFAFSTELSKYSLNVSLQNSLSPLKSSWIDLIIKSRVSS